MDERKPDWIETAVEGWDDSWELQSCSDAAKASLVKRLRAAHEEGCEWKRRAHADEDDLAVVADVLDCKLRALDARWRQAVENVRREYQTAGFVNWTLEARAINSVLAEVERLKKEEDDGKREGA